MIYMNQPEESRNAYLNTLSSVACLSKIFSENTAPYLPYRAVENIYCKDFNATNLGRSDCSADASLDGIGIGIKTFLHKNGKSFEKIAEFNKDSHLYRNLPIKEAVYKIAELRNARIELTMNTYGLTEMIYHCVTRKADGSIHVYELPMEKIDIAHIKNINNDKPSIVTFDDGINEYNFKLTKSTLYRRFNLEDAYLVASVTATILDDPYALLNNFSSTVVGQAIALPVAELEHVILPLYSFRNGLNVVSQKSGLNQWNAAGRRRDPNEIYIPVPRWIHHKFPGFFPERDHAFDLYLPDGEVISAKICQDNGKALMSNPNKKLGQWLLRDILELSEEELLTYEKLEVLGIDSVIIEKIEPYKFSIDFRQTGTFDEFQLEHNE